MNPRISIAPSDAASHKHQSWCVTIDTKRTTPADLLRPQYWAASLLLKSNDLIRCVADDGSYDFVLKVETHRVASGRNAITVSMHPKLTPALVAAAQGTAASEMVPTVVHGKTVPRVESLSLSGNRFAWRLVGFDGQPVGDLHQSEDIASAAYDDYVAAHGLTHEIEQRPVDSRTEEPVVPARTQVFPSDRPGQFSRGKAKEVAKREALAAKRREIDEANKARTAARLAAETVA